MAKRKLIDYAHYAYSHAVPALARCSVCNRPFRVPADQLANPEAARKHLNAEFNAHDCKEDASQTAARIVKQATDR